MNWLWRNVRRLAFDLGELNGGRNNIKIIENNLGFS